MPTVRSQLLELIRDAYPETFEGVMPTKPLGETIFSGPTPHPNEVLNLFIEQKLTSALPMAYYMAARRGLNSLMDGNLPRSATLPPTILRSAIGGFVALRELEVNETHRLVLGSKGCNPCSPTTCPLANSTGPGVSRAHQKVIDRIAGPPQSGGTKVLEVLSSSGVRGDDSDGFCGDCVKEWELGHAEIRKRAWDALPSVFGLRG